MRRQGTQLFVDELMQFAAEGADQRVKAVAEWVGAPLLVAVHGRPGAGCATVARALRQAGSSSGLSVVSDTGPADVDAYVIAEVVKPEDRAVIAASRRPVLVVLNKVDLTECLFRGAGSTGEPIVAARSRCTSFSALVGVPVEPMIGLLAVAALGDLDECLNEDLWAALRVLANHPDGASCLDGSFDGFLAACLPVPAEVRLRLLDRLDVFGTALGVAAARQRRSFSQLRATLRRVSCVDAVVAKVIAAGTQVRYRRVRDAIAELEALAVSRDGIGEFLSRDDTALARMAAAVELAQTSGLRVGRCDDSAAWLSQAVRWHAYGRGPVSELHRACAADIVRASLRLWSRAEGTGDSRGSCRSRCPGGRAGGCCRGAPGFVAHQPS